MELIKQVIEELEKAIIEELDSYDDKDISFAKTEIKILGQFALLLDEEASKNLPLVATMDVDALLKGEWFVQKTLRDSLKAKGLEYDELSGEIWIPKGEEFITYYDSEYLKLSYLDPISTLTSKAIKAKEKNRPLLKEALAYYGDKLSNRIKNHGGDLEYFTSENE